MTAKSATVPMAPLTIVSVAGEREDREDRWVLVAFGLLGLTITSVPPYTDRIGLVEIDGDVARWIGVVLYAAGGVLRLLRGWVLAFRSIAGVVLVALIVLPLNARMDAEERLLSAIRRRIRILRGA